MTLLNSYEELSFLVMKHLRKGVFTNFFMGKEEAIEYINHKMMYYHSEIDFLLLIREYDNRYVINFYLNDYLSADEFWKFLNTLSKKVVIEIPYKKDNIEMINSFEAKLKENGFSKLVDRVKLIRKSEESTQLNNQNIRFVTLDDYEKVKNIFKESFDEYYGCIPTDEIIKKNIEEQKIIGIYDEENLVGILRFDDSSKGVTIKHLAIKSEYRGKGYGKMLVEHLTIIFNDKRIDTWTGKENKAAIKVYEDCGLKLDNYESIVWGQVI